MIRQCFFPTSYRRQSKNILKASNSKEHSTAQNFSKRLDLSVRRPNYSEKHKKSCNEDENLNTYEDETIQLCSNFSRACKSNQIRGKSQNEERIKKKLFLLPQKKQIVCVRQSKSKRRINYHLSSSNTKRVGISEIRNEEWNWKPQSRRINMTERMKIGKGRETENVIVGWDYFQQSDNFF